MVFGYTIRERVPFLCFTLSGGPTIHIASRWRLGFLMIYRAFWCATMVWATTAGGFLSSRNHLPRNEDWEFSRSLHSIDDLYPYTRF